MRAMYYCNSSALYFTNSYTLTGAFNIVKKACVEQEIEKYCFPILKHSYWPATEPHELQIG